MGFGFVDHVSPLMLAVVLGDVLNLNILPTFFEVFGNKTAVTVVRFFLACTAGTRHPEFRAHTCLSV